MAFSIPLFPLAVEIWTRGAYSPNPSRSVTVGNLTYGKRVMTQFWPWADTGRNSVFACLLLPALTDIRSPSTPGEQDQVECPQGSGRFYLVDYVDDFGKGFANEHRFALLEIYPPQPAPLP